MMPSINTGFLFDIQHFLSLCLRMPSGATWSVGPLSSIWAPASRFSSSSSSCSVSTSLMPPPPPPQVVASDGLRAMMESALTARDRVGVQDFVLLENFTSEAAFIENLRKRFKENLIYVSPPAAEGASADGDVRLLF